MRVASEYCFRHSEFIPIGNSDPFWIPAKSDTVRLADEFVDFLNDFNQVKAIIETSDFNGKEKSSWNKMEVEHSEKPLEDLVLYEEQSRLTQILYENANVETIKNLDFHYFKTENWDPEIIHTAQNIIKKWNPY